jgi:hypothetical protein
LLALLTADDLQQQVEFLKAENYMLRYGKPADPLNQILS